MNDDPVANVDRVSTDDQVAALADADPEELVRTVNTVMPFGRFKGRRLLELPEPYLVWFKDAGFPRGKLGEQMALMHEIKVNGIETLLWPLLSDDAADQSSRLR